MSLALAIFDWTRIAAEIWRGSNSSVRREILDVVCLNRTLSDVNLDATKRKPFDFLGEGLISEKSRGERI
jgi:site-specific DNA recombinase